MAPRRSTHSAILLFLAALALPAVAGAAVFSPQPDQASAVLVPQKDGSGTILFSSAGINEQVDRGRSQAVLTIPVEVDNRSRKDLILKALDIWIVTGDGTVIGQPALRQDGIAVWRAEISARRRSQLVLQFRLGSVGPFQRFELHWGGLLAYRPRSGVVVFTAVDGEGYVPPPMAGRDSGRAPGDESLYSPAGGDDEFDELLETYPPYEYRGEAGSWCDYDYWCAPRTTWRIGLSFGTWWYPDYYWYAWYPYYPWYPWYPGYPSYPIYPGYPYYGKRQAKEDAVLRASGREPVSPADYTSGVQRVDVDGARSRDRQSSALALESRKASRRTTSYRSPGAGSTDGRGGRVGREGGGASSRRSPRAGSGSSRRPTSYGGSGASSRGRSSGGGGSMGGARGGGGSRGGNRGGGNRGGGRGR